MYKKCHLFAALLTLSLGTQHAMAAEYAVIVNAANPASGDTPDTRNLLKRIYLKEMTTWANGAETQPLAREAGSPTQAAFHAKILGMSDAAVNEYWLRLKQTKGETPPREVGAARILFRLIEKYEGSFSVVTTEEAQELPPEVKILFTFTD